MSFIKDVQKVMAKKSPEILTGIGLTGMVISMGLTVKGTIKAVKIVEATKEELGVEKLTVKETAKATWKCYLPAAITAVTSGACIILSDSVAMRRNTALATAYKICETGFIEYKDKVIETFGEEKDKVIREQIAEDKMKETPVVNTEVLVTKQGDTLCFDSLSGRYFKSDQNLIDKAVNYLNRRMNLEMYISLNDLYDELGLPRTETGDLLGWNMNTGLIDIALRGHISEDGQPCLLLRYDVEPRYDYSKLM